VAALALSAVPAMLNAGGHVLFSCFLLFCVLAGAGVYQWYLDHMDWMIEHHVADFAVLTWVALGIAVKVHDAAVTQGVVLYQRSGGIWGSNHVGGILILLLPFVQYTPVAIIGYIFLLLNFSRGIWVALLVMLVAWAIWVSAKRALQFSLALIATLAGLLILSPQTIKNEVVSFAMERGAGLALESVGENARWDIYGLALEVAHKTHYAGIGIGGFSWGLERVGMPPIFSNAHDMYLTAFAEGGILFAIVLVGFLGYLLLLSFKLSRPVFVGLLGWAFYGLFSGEIYEAATQITAGDFYTLMFAAAFLMYLRKGNLAVPALAPAGSSAPPASQFDEPLGQNARI
jgi:hypothetical protein